MHVATSFLGVISAETAPEYSPRRRIAQLLLPLLEQQKQDHLLASLRCSSIAYPEESFIRGNDNNASPGNHRLPPLTPSQVVDPLSGNGVLHPHAIPPLSPGKRDAANNNNNSGLHLWDAAFSSLKASSGGGGGGHPDARESVAHPSGTSPGTSWATPHHSVKGVNGNDPRDAQAAVSEGGGESLTANGVRDNNHNININAATSNGGEQVVVAVSPPSSALLLPFGPPPFESSWPPPFLSFCNDNGDVDRTMGPFGLYGGGGPLM
jgi:hypothetical protein